MEINVKVVDILAPSQYVSKKDGQTYVKHYFLGETQGEYPKKICFSVMGSDKFQAMGIRIGCDYTVSFDVNSREWNGKWYTDVSCWKVVAIGGNTQQQPQPQQVSQPSPTRSSQQYYNTPQAPQAPSQGGGDESLPF